MKSNISVIARVCLLSAIALLSACGGGSSALPDNVPLDSLSPFIVSITPDAGAADFQLGSSIRITFSEPMQKDAVESAVTITPAISGSYSWSENDTVLTFTPSQAIAYHTEYSVTIATTLADKAGNHLSAAFNVRFRSAGAATTQLASITPTGQAVAAEVVFNNNGDALSVWLTEAAGQSDISYAYHEASIGQWQAAQTISGVNNYRVISNGSGFALAWIDDVGVQVRQFNNGVATPIVMVGAVPAYQLQLISNNSGYALAWTSAASSGYINAAVYTDSWSAAELFMCTDVDECWASGALQLASNGNGYAVSWLAPGLQSNIMARLYGDDGSGAYAWLVPQIIGADVGDSQVKHVLSSAGQGYGAAWHTSIWWPASKQVHANIHNGNEWGAAQRLDTTDDASDPAITTNGSGYAVAWRHKNSSGISELTARVFLDDGSGWNGPNVRASVDGDITAPVIASNGQGYAVAWSETAGCNGCGQNIHASLYDGNLWSDGQRLNASIVPAGGVILNNDSLQLVSNGQDYASTWLHHDSTNGRSLKFNGFDNNNWSGERDLDSNIPANPSLTVNNNYYAGIWSHTANGADTIMVNVAF